jgi:hypothetical protein
MTSPRNFAPQILISSSVPDSVALKRRPTNARLALAVIVFGLIACSPQTLLAQSPSSSQNPPAQQEGVTAGDYVIHTSAEIGYRYTNEIGRAHV